MSHAGCMRFAMFGCETGKRGAVSRIAQRYREEEAA
jgi:hypothetical protein